MPTDISLHLYKKAKIIAQKAELLLEQGHQAWLENQWNHIETNHRPRNLQRRNITNHTVRYWRMANQAGIKKLLLTSTNHLNEFYNMTFERAWGRLQVKIKSSTDKEVTFQGQAKRAKEAFLKNIFKELQRKKIPHQIEATYMQSQVEMLIIHQTFSWMISLEYSRARNV